jgi:hypothetical protein
MVDYPYILNTGTLRTFLNSIHERGVPDKITTHTLPMLGYKSSNDRPIVKILKFINFIDASGTPTQNYIDYRDTSKAGFIMARALRNAYLDLFKIYPDAYKKDDETLMNFFRSTTKAGEEVVKRMVATFKVLCSFANFEAAPPTGEGEEKEKTREVQVSPSAITFNLNIQLVLPTTDDASVYDKIFKALRDHVLSRG